jgi:predicted DNA-binding transcriptional regulator AlpA
MSRKIGEANPAEPPLESIVKTRDPIRRSSRLVAVETSTGFERLLTTSEAASLLRLSPSWLAKARMRGDGPPYIKLGRSIRYSQTALLLWMRAHQRLSTSQQ